jgi:hypothetical protein
MRRIIACALALGCMIAMLGGCGKNTGRQTAVPLESLPDTYSLQNAESDNCVVYENISITHGQDVWDAFVKASHAGKAGTVRLAFYYTLLDKSHYSAKLYSDIKNDYPVLYIKDLSFDGKKYTIEEMDTDTGKKVSKEYTYLMRYEGTPSSKTAIFSDYVYYVLVNDNTVTWDDLEHGLFSSRSGDAIDFSQVYTKVTYKE